MEPASAGATLAARARPPPFRGVRVTAVDIKESASGLPGWRDRMAGPWAAASPSPVPRRSLLGPCPGLGRPARYSGGRPGAKDRPGAPPSPRGRGPQTIHSQPESARPTAARLSAARHPAGRAGHLPPPGSAKPKGRLERDKPRLPITRHPPVAPAAPQSCPPPARPAQSPILYRPAASVLPPPSLG
jgi:hypothetical protein